MNDNDITNGIGEDIVSITYQKRTSRTGRRIDDNNTIDGISEGIASIT